AAAGTHESVVAIAAIQDVIAVTARERICETRPEDTVDTAGDGVMADRPVAARSPEAQIDRNASAGAVEPDLRVAVSGDRIVSDLAFELIERPVPVAGCVVDVRKAAADRGENAGEGVVPNGRHIIRRRPERLAGCHVDGHAVRCVVEEDLRVAVTDDRIIATV